jgi:hypothetical protein
MADNPDSGLAQFVSQRFDRSHWHWKIKNLERADRNEQSLGVVLAARFCH